MARKVAPLCSVVDHFLWCSLVFSPWAHQPAADISKEDRKALHFTIRIKTKCPNSRNQGYSSGSPSVFRTTGSSTPWELVGSANSLAPPPRSEGRGTCVVGEWGSVVHVLTSPPGDLDDVQV